MWIIRQGKSYLRDTKFKDKNGTIRVGWHWDRSKAMIFHSLPVAIYQAFRHFGLLEKLKGKY